MSEEVLFRGTSVYLGAIITATLNYAGDVAVNRGVQADGAKYADAKPHADWDGGYGNPVRAVAVAAVCDCVCARASPRLCYRILPPRDRVPAAVCVCVCVCPSRCRMKSGSW